MDTARYISIFNTKMNEFLAAIRVLAGNNSALQSHISGLSTMLNLLAKDKPCEMYYTMVTLPYGTFILAGDDEFFMKKTEYPEAGDTMLVNTIKQLWEQLDSCNKETVIQHLKVMVAISKLVHESASVPSN